jgi:hypothetical protein
VDEIPEPGLELAGRPAPLRPGPRELPLELLERLRLPREADRRPDRADVRRGDELARLPPGRDLRHEVYFLRRPMERFLQGVSGGDQEIEDLR